MASKKAKGQSPKKANPKAPRRGAAAPKKSVVRAKKAPPPKAGKSVAKKGAPKKSTPKAPAARAPVAKSAARKTATKAPAKKAKRGSAAAAKARPAPAAPAAKRRSAPTAAPRRFDRPGHLDPKYAAALRAQSGVEDAEPRPFVDGPRGAGDDLAEERGEEVIEKATTGEDEAEEMLDQVVPEEQGGPFVETNAAQEFADDVDASNPKGAKREPFPTT